MKVNIIAPIFGSSGYASHSRQLANALNEVCDVRLVTQLFPNWELQVNDKELEMINKPDSPDRINIIIDLPHNWSAQLNKQKNIGFLVWEGDKIPKHWEECIKDIRVNQVWVPSTHVFMAIKNTLEGEDYEKQMLMQKVKIVPHGVNLDWFKPEKIKPEIFTFLVNKGFRNELDRGGVQHALKAFIQEFKKGEARLILKLNPAYAMPLETVVNIINKYIQECGKLQNEIPEIMFSMENIELKNMTSLYNNSDVLLSPSEAEAFSLPCIESMACGKPVITTDFGGQTDFVTSNNGWIVETDKHEIKHELMYEGISWAKPKLESLKKAMREAYADKEVTDKKGLKAIEDAKNWTWKNSAEKATENLKNI